MKSAYRIPLCLATLGALCFTFEAVASSPVAPAATSSQAPAKAAKAHHAPAPQLKYWGGPSLSADGTQMAWTSYGSKGPTLEIGDLHASHARSVEMPAGQKNCYPGRAVWAPHGQRIAFLSNCGNKDSAQQDVWLVDASKPGLKAHRLTHLDGLVHGLSWSPDGHKLGILYVKGDTHPVAATAASKPRVGVIGVSGVEHQQVALIDAGNGNTHTVTPESLFVYEYDFAPDSSRVAFIGAPPPGANNWWKARLYVQVPGKSEPTELVNAWAAKGSLHHLQMAEPRFSPDGRSIAFIGGLMSDQGATGGDIYVVPSHGGEAVNVTPGIHISPSVIDWVGPHELLATSIAGAGSEIGLFKLHDGQPASHQTLYKTPAAVRLSLAANHSRFVFVHSTFNQAPEIYGARLALSGHGVPAGLDGAVQALTHANTDIKPSWGKGVEMNWHNEGHDVSGWLMLPAHYDPHKKYPMIVNVHGGPVWAFRASWPRGTLAAYSRQGYFVFMPNPRGSLGQGAAFTQAVRRDMGYGDLRDILAGIDAVEKQYSVDDDRLGLSGWSYGGFMSMFAPTQTHRFKAAVAGAGLSNWQSYYGQNMIDQWMLPFFGASVYDDPAVYAKSSAINFIKQDKTPTLIVVGEYDKECPAPQSFEMWHGLRAMGVPTTLVVYAGEGHGFHKGEDMADVVKRSMAWFAKYLHPEGAQAAKAASH